MSNSTSAASKDLYGAQPTVDPATPGSYGVAPSGYRLPEQTSLGGVQLQVSDLTRSITFYQRVLGMRLLSQTPTAASLGAEGSDRPLVSLREKRGARPAARRGRLGLYHFAILLPDRDALARFVRHTAIIGQPIGAGDHLVSEAIYLHDPDDLGIEVYWDRPRDTWQRSGRELVMATDPVDLQGLVDIASAAPWTEMPAGTVMGHVHLHVGDIAQASAFYSEALGFDRMVMALSRRAVSGRWRLSPSPGHERVGRGRRTSLHRERCRTAGVDHPATRGRQPYGTRGVLTAAGAEATRLAGGSLRTVDPWGTAIRIGTRPSLDADARVSRCARRAGAVVRPAAADNFGSTAADDPVARCGEQEQSMLPIASRSTRRAWC